MPGEMFSHKEGAILQVDLRELLTNFLAGTRLGNY